LKTRLGAIITVFVRTSDEQTTPSTRKVRRDILCGKRGQGHDLQRLGRQVRRADPRRVHCRAQDARLTSMAGLLQFGVFCREQGIDRKLHEYFDDMKSGPMVVYPMASQMRLLMDLYVAGEGRVFGLESHAQDPMLKHLAGGYVPSIDVLYDDLGRFYGHKLVLLHYLMAQVSLQRVQRARLKCAHADIDTTVTELFGTQEGARVGPNPRYHGRPSYHPLLMRVAQIDAVVGAQLRAGDRGFGGQDVPTLKSWLRQLRTAVGPDCELRVRMDAAGDCTELLYMLQQEKTHFIIKAKLTQDLLGVLASHPRWRTVQVGADGKPSVQVATVSFAREPWSTLPSPVRVVVVRSTEREAGKQLYLWDGLEYTAQCYLSNDWRAPEEELAAEYNDRAGIEPLIGELKGDWKIGKVPTRSFDANHAAFLLKLLAYNLFRAFLAACHPPLCRWRTRWARRATILRPGRLCRSGRATTLRMAPIRLPMRC
jgi:Transposase DDE domain group 1